MSWTDLRDRRVFVGRTDAQCEMRVSLGQIWPACFRILTGGGPPDELAHVARLGYEDVGERGARGRVG